MKRIIITETQYRKLVSGRLSEDITDAGEKVSPFDIDLGSSIVRRWNENKHTHVERIQKLLVLAGYGDMLEPYGIDGKYGKYTESAVEEFQEDQMPNEPEQWDGEIGPITYQLLFDIAEDIAEENGIEVNDLVELVNDTDFDIEYDMDDELESPADEELEDDGWFTTKSIETDEELEDADLEQWDDEELEDDEKLPKGSEDVINDIIDYLKPDLPINSTTNETDSVILLQQTLLDMGNNLGYGGMDKNGVDGDFGGKTANALNKEINSKELTSTNINKFKDKLEQKIEKIKNTYNDFVSFFDRWNKQGGMDKELLSTCENITDNKDKEWTPKVSKCVDNTEAAKQINEIMPNDNIFKRAAVLSVMMKEQGRGKKICAYNNNYFGAQTDSGVWGGKSGNLITGQFCTGDAERLRTFASFDTPKDGIEFLKLEMEKPKRGWFDDMDDNISEAEASQINYEKWQRTWNLYLTDDDDFYNFTKYGYNQDFNHKRTKVDFTDSRGFYIKPVSSLTPSEKQIHDKHKNNYRTPEKIEVTKNSMTTHFENAVDIFSNLS